MNTIEQAREVAECLRVLTRNRNDGSAYPIAAGTIDALITELAALQEHDAEIERLKDINRTLVDKSNRQNIHDARQAETIAEQRKALEQVLNTLIDVTASINMKRFWRDKDGKRFDEITDTAITAIQGVLK